MLSCMHKDVISITGDWARLRPLLCAPGPKEREKECVSSGRDSESDDDAAEALWCVVTIETQLVNKPTILKSRRRQNRLTRMLLPLL